ncbi:hypothetical protein ACH4SK_28475 [Streptomyces inhibens]|uniref:hypothetical protein n=1 Tax=Streptomyces inhibens TaxID=2293571 RepID=UPI003799FBBE
MARLLGAAELGLELDLADRASSLLQQAEHLELGVLERARLLLLRERREVHVAASTPRLHLLITTAERASEAGDPELALRLLRTAARRCWWSAPGRELRERVVAAAERLPVPELHPDLVYTLAAATPVVNAYGHATACLRHAGGGGLRAQGRLGPLAPVRGLRRLSICHRERSARTCTATSRSSGSPLAVSRGTS